MVNISIDEVRISCNNPKICPLSKYPLFRERKIEIDSRTDWAFSINNTRDSMVEVAILPGICSTLGLDLRTGKYHRHDTSQLREYGIKVDSVLDEADDQGILMQQLQPDFSIRTIRAHYRSNYQWLKHITIDSSTAPNVGKMKVASMQELKKPNLREITIGDVDLRTGRLEISFDWGILQTNENLFWSLQIPAKTEYTVQIEFY